MVAHWLCNPVVAGSTPVTSSKKYLREEVLKMSMRDYGVDDYGMVLNTNHLQLLASKVCSDYSEKEWSIDACYFMEDEEFEERGLTRKEAESRIDEIAREKRRNINKYDMSWELALDEALKDFWSEY